jgi:hypothetical protein
MVEETNDEEFMANFTNEEIRYGIDQYAQVKLGMSGDEFITKVRNGEQVGLLHHRAQEVADLIPLLDRKEGNTNEQA